jgi:methyltransferase (TIGR00027 family)
MHDDRPSTTALRAAVARARHQLIDSPKVFDDPLALRIVGTDTAHALMALGRRRDNPYLRGVRASLVARSRITEDALHEAVRHGCSQYVVLGAGLDTFALRSPYPADRLQVFEVDHPATQGWKRQRLASVGLDVPAQLRWVPVNFGRDSLREALLGAGFDRTRPAFFSWLGVTMYLPPEVTLSTLRDLAGLARAGGDIVFDVLDDPATLNPLLRLCLFALRPRFARLGEPWIGHFAPERLRKALLAMGFDDVRRHDAGSVNPRFFASHPRGLRMRALGAIMQARLRPLAAEGGGIAIAPDP